ncbi:MAG TPA: M1 family aminopeptidase [Pseudonocardiaceae bacterium]|nr:M1 family aminopeptidase [Pseudonocardiaceae bacterium]
MRQQRELLAVESYELEITVDPAAIACRTVIHFRCHQPGTTVFADLAATQVDSVIVNGRAVDVAVNWDGSRLTVPNVATSNGVEVAALFPYNAQDRGYRLVSDAADTYVYDLAYPRSAPKCFCCFDDPRLRAHVTVTMTVPAGWNCLANGPVAVGEGGRWRFAPTAPIAPYVVAMAAGPWSVSHHRTIRTATGMTPITIHARRSRGATTALGRRVADLAERSLLAYEAILGVPYPYRKCDIVFVPDLPPLAFSAPGIIMIKDDALDATHDREPEYAATVIGHEVAHAWFGGSVDWMDAWLNEALTTYISHVALERYQSNATNGDQPDAAYASDARLISDLETTIGRDAVLRGLQTFLQRYADTTATRLDLTECWSQAGGHDLTTWAQDRTP